MVGCINSSNTVYDITEDVMDVTPVVDNDEQQVAKVLPSYQVSAKHCPVGSVSIPGQAIDTTVQLDSAFISSDYSLVKIYFFRYGLKNIENSGIFH